MKILITGGSGYIGSLLIPKLLASIKISPLLKESLLLIHDSNFF